MSIHTEIAITLDRLRAAFDARTGAKNTYVHFELKTKGSSALIYTLCIRDGFAVNATQVSLNSEYGGGPKTLDAAFDLIEQKIATLRTYQDELADLYAGLAPVAMPIEEAA